MKQKKKNDEIFSANASFFSSTVAFLLTNFISTFASFQYQKYWLSIMFFILSLAIFYVMLLMEIGIKINEEYISIYKPSRFWNSRLFISIDDIDHIDIQTLFVGTVITVNYNNSQGQKAKINGKTRSLSSDQIMLLKEIISKINNENKTNDIGDE